MSTGNEGLKLTSQFKILRLFCFFCNFWWNLHCCTTSCRAKRVLWHGTQGCGQAWLHIKRFVNTKFWPKAFKCLIIMALLYIKIPPILFQVLPCDAMIAPPTFPQYLYKTYSATKKSIHNTSSNVYSIMYCEIGLVQNTMVKYNKYVLLCYVLVLQYLVYYLGFRTYYIGINNRQYLEFHNGSVVVKCKKDLHCEV